MGAFFFSLVEIKIIKMPKVGFKIQTLIFLFFLIVRIDFCLCQNLENNFYLNSLSIQIPTRNSAGIHSITGNYYEEIPGYFDFMFKKDSMIYWTIDLSNSKYSKFYFDVENNLYPKEKTQSVLKYTLGSKKTQDFLVSHQQRLTSSVTYNLFFRSGNSEGYYLNQKASDRSFGVNFFISALNKKYFIDLGYESNRIMRNENGGLKNDSLLELSNSIDSKTLPVNFGNVVNLYKQKDFKLSQKYSFKKSEQATGDSIGSENNDENFLVKHDFIYSLMTSRFIADKYYNDFFENAYFDSLITNDSLSVKRMSNAISFNYQPGKISKNNLELKMLASVAFMHEWFTFKPYDFDTSVNNFSINPFLIYQLNKKCKLKVSFTKHFNDDKENYYSAMLGASYDLNNLWSFEFYTKAESAKIDWVYLYWISNHFIWNNSFDATKMYTISPGVIYRLGKNKISAQLKFEGVENISYFDSFALPQQANKTANITSIFVSHQQSFNKIEVAYDVEYKNTNFTEVVRIPRVSIGFMTCYNIKLFKDALTLKTGFNVRYFSKYYANAYMPATRQFYLQDEKQIGNYPFVNVFVNIEIKRAEVFFRIDHLNEGWSGRNYYEWPHYPAAGRTLKFGLRWIFYD